ncbi:U2 small nuclear ribonucleoprotein B [Massariosphaeria phaeospora]|uniref:U2 small nuclear ribonucleoprotein B n=1 Tax=Massariosphaeria phaeospora TaxID=100035 RepID=A0A7C8MHH2_9PLEO|nr:U2 small nuclear ribonucleoprotein B [Massariosphaeria phaeospora]
MADKMEGVTAGGGGSGLVDPSNYPVPIETVYVNNLDEHVKLDTIKLVMRRIFEYYGEVLDVIAKGSLRRKGQAFIVFNSEKSVLDSVEIMHGFPLYGRPMGVRRAKTHSDATVMQKAPAIFDEHKRKRLMLKDRKRAEEDAKAQANPAEKPRAAKPVLAVPDEYVRPNKTLFLQNIPKDVDAETLTAIFEKFEGFKEVRAIAIKAVAFAEFANEQFAITAKEATANMPIGAEGQPMKVSYQRQ